MRRSRSLIVLAGALLVLAGCSSGPPPTLPSPLTGLIPGRGPGDSTLTIDDEGRYVIGYTVPPNPEMLDRLTVSNPGGDPTRLRVSWAGGVCRLDATITIRPAAAGFRLIVAESPCVPQAAMFRTVDLQLKSAIPANAIELVDRAST